jgi:cytochrome c peroxidase
MLRHPPTGVTDPLPRHDGSFETLEEVIEHYNSGGKNHPNQSSILRPLFLSQKDKSDLVAFLKTLTDEK